MKHVANVLGMVYWLKEPPVFRNEEIDMIRHFLQEHRTVHLKKTPINIGEMVSVNSSSLVEQDGYFLSKE